MYGLGCRGGRRYAARREAVLISCRSVRDAYGRVCFSDQVRRQRLMVNAAVREEKQV